MCIRDRVYAHGMHIVGERYLQIVHDLMALDGVGLEGLQEVHSHPMALLQCKKYLKNLPDVKLVETSDTAASARAVSEQRLEGVAAIAPTRAAELYGLKVIAPGIQTIKDNATRFIVLQRTPLEPNGDTVDKASLRFLTDHKRGSLATVLNVMSDCNLNLTKIQSLPIIETPWKYAFFVDVTFDDYANFGKARSLLEIMSDDFTVLGEYQSTLIR